MPWDTIVFTFIRSRNMGCRVLCLQACGNWEEFYEAKCGKCKQVQRVRLLVSVTMHCCFPPMIAIVVTSSASSFIIILLLLYLLLYLYLLYCTIGGRQQQAQHFVVSDLYFLYWLLRKFLQAKTINTIIHVGRFQLMLHYFSLMRLTIQSWPPTTTNHR